MRGCKLVWLTMEFKFEWGFSKLFFIIPSIKL